MDAALAFGLSGGLIIGAAVGLVLAVARARPSGVVIGGKPKLGSPANRNIRLS